MTTNDWRERVVDPDPRHKIVYSTAFEAVAPNSIQMDMLLGLLVHDAPNVTGWHQIVQCKEPVAGDTVKVVRTFDLVDGEDLGPGYRDRTHAKHVTMKARVHWAEWHKHLFGIIKDQTGFDRQQFTHESVYFTARAQVRESAYMWHVLTAMRSLHVALVRAGKLKEK